MVFFYIFRYIKAANQGITKAQNNLAIYYYIGQGINQDTTKAIYWLTKSSIRGNSSAQFNLGLIYEKENDLKQAIFW
jgi:TPR repeat protein